MKQLIAEVRPYFRQWFHKRNIIIVSEHKVKHIHVGPVAQFCALALLVAGVCWASYSTGSFIAARSALKERNQTLRSVANARIETNFNPMFQVTPAASGGGDIAHSKQVASALSDPMFTLATMDHNKLFARIAFLEYQVEELKNTNQAMIERVRDKTSGRIDDLESIIKQTGLSADDLEQDIGEKPHSRHAARNGDNGKAEGGPYIPAEPIATFPHEYEMFDSLDRLAVLREIVGNLPLAVPVENANEQSPFGHRIDPFTGHLAFHPGLDLAGPTDAKIHCTADGTVAFAGRGGAYGNVIDIDHGFGISTRYGHLSEILVKEGQEVHKGDIIGVQGSTGRSTGPHLHYEVRYHNQPMNPKNFLSAGDYVSQE